MMAMKFAAAAAMQAAVILSATMMSASESSYVVVADGYVFTLHLLRAGRRAARRRPESGPSIVAADETKLSLVMI